MLEQAMNYCNRRALTVARSISTRVTAAAVRGVVVLSPKDGIADKATRDGWRVAH
jgi:hypothetical protein